MIDFRARDIASALGLPPGALDYYFAGDAADFSDCGDFHATSDRPSGPVASNLYDAAFAVGKIVENSPFAARAFWRVCCGQGALHFCCDTPNATAKRPPIKPLKPPEIAAQFPFYNECY